MQTNKLLRFIVIYRYLSSLSAPQVPQKLLLVNFLKITLNSLISLVPLRGIEPRTF